MTMENRFYRKPGDPYNRKNGFKEQDPEEWYSAFCALSHALTDKIPAKDISALIFPVRCRM